MKEVKRPAIKSEERLKLWVRSGGRCAICNKYLLEDDYFEVSLGEMAHVVAWRDAKKAPRGNSALSSVDRNKVENLMLLCADDHKIIDYKNLPELFTIQTLLDLKRQHEERVLHLTGFKTDATTTVIRLFGRIREASVELSRQHAFEVVWKQSSRYASFSLSFDRSSIEVDLNQLQEPEKIWDAYWLAACSQIDECISKIKEGVNKGKIEHLSVFGFCRIPLLAYLGYQLDDKIPTDIYQKHRGESESWLWPEDDSKVDFAYNQLQASPTTENVAFVVSISGTIALNELPDHINETFNIFEIKPVGTIPHRNIINSKGSLDGFAACYHQLLSYLEIGHKSVRWIHLFLAVPTSIALICGRGIMRHAQPAIKIYDRSNNKYHLALIINEL